MSLVEPVDPRVRLAIARWPDDAPRGSVTTFCLEYEIARKTFYAIRKRAQEEGQAAALQPRTRRPAVSPNRISDDVKTQAIGVRAALEQSGLDHGPISVHEKMRSLRMEPVPAVSSLARIFRDAGVVRLEPKKKPRASYRRFVYPAPNACWQLGCRGQPRGPRLVARPSRPHPGPDRRARRCCGREPGTMECDTSRRAE